MTVSYSLHSPHGRRPVFDLGLTEEQQQLTAAYRSLFERECDTEVVRDAEETGFSPSLWQRLVELGGVDMALPEADGGAGAQFLDVTLVAELAGRFLVPVPLAESVAALRLLSALGTDPARRLLSEALAEGVPVTLTPRPPLRRSTPLRASRRRRRSSAGPGRRSRHRRQGRRDDP
jgi:Acyl-CoA dehydrogenase, N-terminal domain